MKQRTDKQKAKAAIKWIDALPKYRKTTGILREGNKPSNYSYCCLGVGATVCRSGDNMYGGFAHGLADRCGLFSADGELVKLVRVGGVGVVSLVHMNDELYNEDTDFTRVRKFILRHLGRIFEPGVAKILKAHYKNEKAAKK